MSKLLLKHTFYFGIQVRTVIALLLACAATTSIKAQKIDSLLSVLKIAKEDTNKTKLLHTLALNYWHNTNDKALEYANLELELAEKLNYKRGQISAFGILGGIHFKQGFFEKAISDYMNCLKIVEATTNDQYFISKCYSNIASILATNKQPDKALEYYYKSLQITKELKKEYATAVLYNNIGIIYKEKGDFKKAEECYLISLEKRKLLGDKFYMSETYSNIGNLYYEMGRKEDALKNHEEALKLQKESEDEYGIATTNLNIGIYYNDKRDFKKALLYLNEACNYFVKSGDQDWELSAYLNLAQTYKGLKEYERATFYLEEHKELNDTLYSKEQAERISELQIKYETEKKEKEIELLKQKETISSGLAEKSKLQTIIVLIGGLLLLAVLLLIVLRSRSRKKQEALELEKNKAVFEQQALRAQMNPHFIFNALNSIQHYILGNETQYAYDYLAKFSKLIRQVLTNSQRNDITLKDELDLLKLYIELEHRRFAERFDYEINCPDEIQVDDIKIPVMIIQPFVENAVWHGIMNLDKSIKGLVSVNFEIKDKQLKISIEDNGVGREEAAKRKGNNEYQSVGMMFTQKRLELFKTISKEEARIEVLDLKDGAGKATGTRVEIYITVNN